MAQPTFAQKMEILVLSALIFAVISSPTMYRLVQQLAPFKVVTRGGCPTTGGLALHSVVFALVVYLYM